MSTPANGPSTTAITPTATGQQPNGASPVVAPAQQQPPAPTPPVAMTTPPVAVVQQPPPPPVTQPPPQPQPPAPVGAQVPMPVTAAPTPVTAPVATPTPPVTATPTPTPTPAPAPAPAATATAPAPQAAGSTAPAQPGSAAGPAGAAAEGSADAVPKTEPKDDDVDADGDAEMSSVYAARREEEMARRDRSLAEFLVMLDGYKPLIPEEVTEYYLQRAGFECSDPRLKRLLSLSAQKFISDLSRDAFHFAKLRVNGTTAGRGRPAAGVDRNRVVLTMDDLSLALGEHGVNVKKPDYYL